MSTEMLTAMSTALWLLTASIFVSIYGTYRDKMMARLALAFFLIFVSRYINYYTDISPLLKHNIVITIRAASAYMIVIAALNGHRRNKHTDYWLGAFLLVALCTQWFTPTLLVPKYFSLGPVLFITLIGWLFAAWRMLVDPEQPYENCFVCRIFGAVCLSRAIVSFLIFNPNLPANLRTTGSVLDIITLGALMLVGYSFSFYRHRIFMECERTPVGELKEVL